LLKSAAEGLDAADMELYASAARWRQGEILGGEAGGQRVADSKAWMTAQSIRNPALLMRVLAPGAW
jgi:hypothetical protein